MKMKRLFGILATLVAGVVTLQAVGETAKAPDMTKPVKVFILMGQSNP